VAQIAAIPHTCPIVAEDPDVRKHRFHGRLMGWPIGRELRIGSNVSPHASYKLTCCVAPTVEIQHNKHREACTRHADRSNDGGANLSSLPAMVSPSRYSNRARRRVSSGVDKGTAPHQRALLAPLAQPIVAVKRRSSNRRVSTLSA
jgi:hypothetical protein